MCNTSLYSETTTKIRTEECGIAIEVFMTACVVLFPSVLSLKVTPGYEPDYNDLIIKGNDVYIPCDLMQIS